MHVGPVPHRYQAGHHHADRVRLPLNSIHDEMLKHAALLSNNGNGVIIPCSRIMCVVSWLTEPMWANR